MPEASTTPAELRALVEQGLGPWALRAWAETIAAWATTVDATDRSGWAGGWSRERALRWFAAEHLPECASIFPPRPETARVNWAALGEARARVSARIAAERKAD
jgi:hypothetical protein